MSDSGDSEDVSSSLPEGTTPNTTDQTSGGCVFTKEPIFDIRHPQNDKPVNNPLNESIRYRAPESKSSNTRAVPDRQNQNHTERRNSRPPQSTTSGETIRAYVSWLVIILFLVYFYLRQNVSSPDIKTPNNPNFAAYYGIPDMKNYFETENADDCNSMIIFRPALPREILKADHSASSFMALAKYGYGKTLLRCEYFKSLSPNDYVKVPVLNHQITEYLDRFVSSVGANKSYCQTNNCLNNWSENEFAQVLLSTLVTEFINTYDERNFKNRDLVLDEKISLITIVCYYYNDKGTEKLEAFVNSFLSKGMFAKYTMKNPEEQLLQENAKNDRQLLKHLQDDLAKFVILNKDFGRFLLLMSVVRGEGFEVRARNKHLYDSNIQDLVEFSSFIRSCFKKMPVFVVDGIDDSNVFLRDNKVNGAALESFIRSSISRPIIAAVLADNFHLSLFYPKIDTINVENVIIQKDKFPTHVISWNRKALLNYADYVLEEMNKKASPTRRKPFPDFKTLVNYSNEKVAEIIDKIPGPRALQLFMLALAEEIDSDSGSGNKLYLASLTNVDNAYQKSLESFDRKQMMETAANVVGSEEI